MIGGKDLVLAVDIEENISRSKVPRGENPINALAVAGVAVKSVVAAVFWMAANYPGVHQGEFFRHPLVNRPLGPLVEVTGN